MNVTGASALRPTRRGLLKGSAAALLATAPGLRHVAFAAAGTPRPLLVVVYLRGGCDGLNLISPASDPDFVAARATEIRVAAEGDAAGHSLANGPDPRIDFRLHRAAAGLAELYAGGNLAFIHAAGLTDSTRSHFVATDMIERGVADAHAMNATQSGWLARIIDKGTKPRAGEVRLLSATSKASGLLRGADSAMVAADLSNGLALPGGDQGAKVLQALYEKAGGDVGVVGREAVTMLRSVDAKLPRNPQHRVEYHPEASADYGPAADLARSLKVVAQLTKLEVGLEAATVDFGNWDTHEGQTGRFRELTGRLSAGLLAFWNDMAAYHDRLTVVVVSEFGRRLRSNRSGGTDHGRGGVMAVLGGRVAGGRFYGKWPGLASDRLDEGVDLAVATDYRQVLSEVLTAQGRDPGTILPGYRSPGTLGLFAQKA